MRRLRAGSLRGTGWLCLGLMLGIGGAILPVVVTAADQTAVMKLLSAPEVSTLLDDGDLESLREAVGQSLVWLERQPASRKLIFGSRTVTATQQSQGLRRLLALLADDPAPEVLEERVLGEFDVLKSVGSVDRTVLITGYHEPVIEAAERPSPTYSVPIFAVPEDLVEVSLGASTPPAGRQRIAGRFEGQRIVPYWSRAEIEEGRLARRGRVLAWARDPVDVFFMEVEGSGTLRLPDGREIRVGYAATNGRPYRSIGRLLIDERRMPREAVSMQSIRAWLAAHPEERSRVLRYNESFVFFSRRAAPPLGSLGVPLTPERSIATDSRLFPPGALAFVRAERPALLEEGRVGWRPLSRFVLNQDTGGAIRGPGRVDVFWGRGMDAELAASLMQQQGELYFLVPKAPRATAGTRGR